MRCVEGGQRDSVSAIFLAKCQRQSYAFTYASVQGRYCKGTVGLFDTNQQRSSRRHVVKGSSRATSADAVWIADWR